MTGSHVDVCGSVFLLEVMLVSMAPVMLEGYVDVRDLCCHLKILVSVGCAIARGHVDVCSLAFSLRPC